MTSGDDRPVMVYGTFPDSDTAMSIAGELIDSKLAACVNILPGMTAIYNWEGRRQVDGEVAAIMKTRAGLADRLIELVRARHPYDVPALVVLPIIGGLPLYLDWIRAETEPAPAPRSPGSRTSE